MIRIALIACLVTLPACHDLDTGEPPTFSGFTVTTLNEDQIQITWSPGSDDLTPPPELEYAIWYALDGELNTDGSPQTRTGEGAISWTLTGLDANTAYDILVRASDKGTTYSPVQDPISGSIRSATTSMEGQGLFETEITTSISQPSGLVIGNVLSADREAIGIINASTITWYALDESNLVENQTNDIRETTDILEAHTIQLASGSRSDVLTLTANGLSYYDTTATGIPDAATFTDFRGVPEAGTLDFAVGSDGLLDILSYVDTDRRARFYTFVADPDMGEDNWQEQGTVDLPSGGTILYRMTDFDRDDNPDLAYFHNNILYVRLGDADYTFDAAEEVETITEVSFTEDGETRTATISAATTDITMGLFDGNGDNAPDIHLFFRDMSQDLTLLLIYRWDDDASGFDPVFSQEFDQATYATARFVDANGSGPLELVCTQSAGNNIAVFRAGANGTFSSPEGFYGFPSTTDDAVDFATFADLDNQNRPDSVMVSGSTLAIMLWRPQ